MKRGYVLTWDSLIALSVVLLLMVGFVGLQYSSNPKRGTDFEEIHYSAEDAMETISKNGILEEVGFQWASGNYPQAANLSKEYLEQLLPPYVGYRIEVVNASGAIAIYESGASRISEGDAKDKTRATRFISGYKEFSPRQGWTARSWLVVDRSWADRVVCDDASCMPEKREVNLTYYVGMPFFKDFFYFKVNQEGSLTNATFNVSWAQGVFATSTVTTSTTTTTTTTSTSTTTTTTTTTTTLICHNCNECGMGSGFYTSDDYYNYHYFDIPAVLCNVTVKLTFGSGASYDLYLNWTGGYCPQYDVTPESPETDEYLWGPIDSCISQSVCDPLCNSYFRRSGYDGSPAACSRRELPLGRYHAMVDCYSYYPGLCSQSKPYSIDIELEGEGCTTSTTTSTTTSSTTTTSTTTTSTTSTTTTTTSTTSSTTSTTTSTTSTTTTSTTTTIVTCSGVKTTSLGNKLIVQDHAVGSLYNPGQTPKDLSSDDIASGCVTPSCYNPYPTTPVPQCPEDAGTPVNAQSFTFRVYIPSTVNTISFAIRAAPQDGCDSYINVSYAGNVITQCHINPGFNCMGSSTTRWRECTATATKAQLQNAGVVLNSDNDLEIKHEMLGGTILVAPGNYECFTAQLMGRWDYMHFDWIGVSCAYM